MTERPPADPGALDELLARKVEEARQAWPDVTLDPVILMPYLAERLAPGNPLAALAALNVTDLYLACGCAHGDARALAAFERALFREVDLALAAKRETSVTADDIKQQLRQRLFVADPEGVPRIAGYAGTGELRTWFRVVATRAIISELRKTRREVSAPEPILDSLPTPAADSELSLIKERYRAQFKAAFEHAVRSLEPRQRNLLRQQLVDQLGVDEIAAIYRAHRVTIARWLAEARKDVWKATRAALTDQLDLPSSELEAALQEIRSQLDLSLSRVLKVE